MSAGASSAAVFRLTFSAPASIAAAASSSVLMPPPTVNGMKMRFATAATVAASARRPSSVAVTSRMTTSSIPSWLYRSASSAGSPALRRPSKLTPLTTCPFRTSRQAMIRLDNIQKILQHAKPHIARFFRMKLHAEDLAAFDRTREGHDVRRHRDRLVDHRRRIGVCEIHLRTVWQPLEQAGGTRKLELVPSDVRNLVRPGGFEL